MEVRPVVESFAHSGEDAVAAIVRIIAKTVLFAAVEGVILRSVQKAAIK